MVVQLGNGCIVVGRQGVPLAAAEGAVLHWAAECNWHGHRHLVNEECERLWGSDGAISLSLSLSLSCVFPAHWVERDPFQGGGLECDRGEQALGHRKSLGHAKILCAFGFLELGSWEAEVLAKKISVDEGSPRRVLAFVGSDCNEGRVVLELVAQNRVFTNWQHQGPTVRVKVSRGGASILAGTAVPEDAANKERVVLAQEAWDAAGISEFRVSGSLRASWYEAQRKDASLTAALRRTEAPFKVAGDGLLEREVTLKTGQVVHVPVVPNGVAGANGVTWRRACYNSVQCGVLGGAPIGRCHH